jgi:hypothetical protein
MKNIYTFKKSSNIFEIRKFLQTIYQEFFHNNQVSRQVHQEESFVFMIERLSNDI